LLDCRKSSIEKFLERARSATRTVRVPRWARTRMATCLIGKHPTTKTNPKQIPDHRELFKKAER
jgi:hypothetical protein